MIRWLKRGLVALGLALLLLVAYGSLVEPRLLLDVERHRVALPGLPPELGGTQVAVISDLQIGMWFANTGMVERAVAHAVRVEPDAILLAGDFVYSGDPDVAVQVDSVVRMLEPITHSGIPAFAVLGNHDYAVRAADELIAGLENAGITVLSNEAAELTRDGNSSLPLHIVGLGPVVPDRVDVSAALSEVPEDAPRLVMMHNPTAFPDLPAGAAPLAVAGHTHCGQVALPGRPRWSYIGLTEEERIVADAWAPDHYGAPGNRMFVTCGIGFSVVPIRINAPPQLVLFTFVSPDDSR